MATSSTYTFNPALGALSVYAYNLAGLRATSLLQEHFEAARMASNMICASWSNRGVNLWAVDLVTTPLVASTATYAVDASTVMILDAYLVTDSVDRVIMPISRTEYASYPNKDTEGTPSVYWFDRLISPTITLWAVPDAVTATSLKYYRVRRIQDAALTNAQQVEIPYLWLEAFAYALAQRLALIWSPDKAQMLKVLADEAYTIAAEQNTEYAAVYITPQLSSYWRP